MDEYKCPVCHVIAPPDIPSSGYTGLHYCATCRHWIDRVDGATYPVSSHYGPTMTAILEEPIVMDTPPPFEEDYPVGEPPAECPECHEMALFSKSDAGYPGLYHCAACRLWIDKLDGTQWRVQP